MLDAWIRGKRRGTRTIYEDEIVSIVFGHLQYFPSRDRAAVFQGLWQYCFEDDQFAKPDDIEICEIELWPNLSERGRVEPDVVMRAQANNSTTGTNRKGVLLVEAKWDSPASGGQLSMQWKSATSNYADHEVLHLFLTRQPLQMDELQDLRPDLKHCSNLKTITWSRLGQVLRSLGAKSSEFSRWANGVLALLTLLGEAPLDGLEAAVRRAHPSLWGCRENVWHFESRLVRLLDTVSAYDRRPEFWLTPVWKFHPSVKAVR